MMKQWITIASAVAAGILVAVLLIVALGWLGAVVTQSTSTMMLNPQGMMNMQGMNGMMSGMSSMSNMGQMMQPMMGNVGN